MPQDVPRYAKVVFISYNSNDWSLPIMPSATWNRRSKEFAIWLYQRLKYSRFPVRTYSADEAIGGAGFAANSIAVTDPLIAVWNSSFENRHTVMFDLKAASEKGKDIVFALFEETEIPHEFEHIPVFDFRGNSDKGFEELKEYLATKTYPKTYDTRNFVDTRENLRIVHQYLAENDLSAGGSLFYIDYFYTNVFSDILGSEEEKTLAIREISRFGILSGLLLAVLSDDPSAKVRASAAIGLAKFTNPQLVSPLQRAAVKDSSNLVRLCSQLALGYIEDPRLINRIFDDMRDILFHTTLQPEPIPSRAHEERTVQRYQNNDDTIFLSYARRDAEPYAQLIAAALRREGINIWMDSDLQPGTVVWQHEIERAITNCRFVIALLSPAAYESEWVAREIQFAQQEAKEIIPVFAHRTRRPISLSTSQGLRGDPILSEKQEETLEFLIDTIHNKLGHHG